MSPSTDRNNGDTDGPVVASALMWFGLALLIVAALVWGATAAAATRTGGPGPQTLRGTPGADRLSGMGGDDTLIGLGGSDRLLGGSGDDVLFGGRGDDTLAGGPGRDRIWAGPGDDVIRAAGTPRDRIDCGAGADTVYAPAGTPTRHCERVVITPADAQPVPAASCEDGDPATTDYDDPETGDCLRWPYP